ncbi:MAG TPA: sigma-54 dependent transcriptional regulator, partial [Longimicrobium sp.]|nr:sigma-54 dependent transcriptional regulator [Longimicrobium sp.]
MGDPKILIVDDETAILDTLRILLKREGFQVDTAVGGQQGIDRMNEAKPDVVLTDVRMPGVGGLEVLLAARDVDANMPVILMTAQASLQTAIRAVNEGAYYYIQKPFANDELVAIVRRAAESRQLKRENQALRTEIRRRERGDAVRPIGRSKSFLDALKLAETVGPTDSTVLISGNSGTGKEVLAHYIHEMSNRADGPFVSINCGALPENLLESELFGHVRGSFTGAVRDKQGLFVAAKGGTFFLDEVGEMSPATQVKLLRVLQEREVIPVGATEALPVDVRIIAATNRDLDEEIRRGGFRSDLFYRLNVITLHLPPLSERPDDVALLAEHFVNRLRATRGRELRITPETMEVLQGYDWPGNVRELENALERAAVMTPGEDILPSALPARIMERAPQ